MSEARVRQKRGQRLLKENPICIYCGAPATTTDHCPPRCFFEGRHWPETYEFPACKPCNERARLDEQALAVLIRAKATGAMNHEWEKLAQGVKNNQPAIVAEWTSLSRNEQKHALRDLFGRDSADNLRRLGWKAFNVGPLSEAMINRFMVKLSKALYFRHNNALLDGVVYVLHINALSKDITPEFMNSILAIPTSLPALQRNNTPCSTSLSIGSTIARSMASCTLSFNSENNLCSN